MEKSRLERIEDDQKDLVSFYANSKIWYDSLSSAFELYQSGENIYWSQLLNSTGMDKLVN